MPVGKARARRLKTKMTPSVHCHHFLRCAQKAARIQSRKKFIEFRKKYPENPLASAPPATGTPLA
jgi:hypothetical protein